MIGRIIQIVVVGVVCLFCSTPQGMAKEFIPEEVRADFFMSEDSKDSDRQSNISLNDAEDSDRQANISLNDAEDSDRQGNISFSDAALLPGAEIVLESDSDVECGKENPRQQKRNLSPLRNLFKCRFSSTLAAKLATKGAPTHPLTQDALQERAAAVRFLQICALDC